MITVGGKSQSNNAKQPSGLANLISAMQESYHIPASLIPKMTSGLEKALCDYLSEFLSENNLSESARADYILSLSGDLDEESTLKVISEACRTHGSTQIQYNGQELIDVRNESGSATYQLGDVDIDKLSADSLLEAWECPDIDHMMPLFKGILSQLRKE